MDGYNLAQWCVCARTFVGFVILFRVCLARVAFCASLTLRNALPGQTGARFNPYEDEHYSKELPADGHQTNQWPFVNRLNCIALGIERLLAAVR